MKGWSRAALVAVFLVVMGAGQVLAHANLLQAEPAPNSAHPDPPREVVLTFSEPLDPQVSRIEVLSADRQAVTSAAASVDPADPTIMRLALPSLPPGVYTVAWRALSTVDGHLTRGVYPFVVGRAESAPGFSSISGPVPGSFGEARPVDVLGRVLGLIGAALIAGGFGLHLVLWRPVRTALQLPGSAGDRELERLLAAGLVMAFTGTLLSLIAQIQVLGSDAEIGAFLLGSRFAHGLIGRLFLLVLLAVVVRRARAGGSVPLLLGLLSSAAYLGITTALSHSAAVEVNRPAALLNDWVHLAAASLWIGGLAHLLVVAVPAIRAAPESVHPRGFGTLVRRFSALGIASVAALVITGLLSSWIHVGSLEALRTTAYGQTLSVKLGLIVPLLGLAALNLLHWRRRVAAAGDARRGFVQTLRAEMVAGLLVLAVVGLLTGLGPARSALEARQSQILTLRQTTGPLSASLSIVPPQPGQARFEVRLSGPDGAPYTIARRVRLQFTPPDTNLGVADVIAESRGDGRYVAEGAYLSLPGQWRVELQVQRPDGYDLFSRFDLQVDTAVRPASEGAGSAGAGEWLGRALVGGGVLLVGFAFALRRQRDQMAIAPVVLGMGLLLAITGTFQLFTPTTSLGDSSTVKNPIAPTEASIARGEELYGQYCQSCHGPGGAGHGPTAAQLDSPPADLHVHVPLHPDGEIYNWITNGIPGTAMPAQGDRIAPEDRWHIVNYLRALTSS